MLTIAMLILKYLQTCLISIGLYVKILSSAVSNMMDVLEKWTSSSRGTYVMLTPAQKYVKTSSRVWYNGNSFTIKC